MKPLMTAVVILCGCLFPSQTPVHAADQSVKLEKKETSVEVTIGGKEFTVYHIDKKQPKPFFSPPYSSMVFLSSVWMSKTLRRGDTLRSKPFL